MTWVLHYAQNPHGRKRELIPASCLLTSTYPLWQVCCHLYAQTCTHKTNKQTDFGNRNIKNVKERRGHVCSVFLDKISTGTDIYRSLAYISRSISVHNVTITREHKDFLLRPVPCGPVGCEMLVQWDQHSSIWGLASAPCFSSTRLHGFLCGLITDPELSPLANSIIWY